MQETAVKNTSLLFVRPSMATVRRTTPSTNIKDAIGMDVKCVTQTGPKNTFDLMAEQCMKYGKKPEKLSPNFAVPVTTSDKCGAANGKKRNKTMQTVPPTFKIYASPTASTRETHFFGGRTNAAKLYHKVSANQKIHYIDFTSLYPYVNKKSRHPIGHPEVITNPGTTDISDYFGLIKCKVRPPKKLYHPVLPKRAEGKLLFPLCDACVAEQLQKPYRERTACCNHLDIEREFTGTWCSPELEKAVEKGYEIVTIYEVYHFKESKVGLFDKYVNKWLKVKQEASGWPSWCQTEEQKQQYIQAYEAKEGIRLEYNSIAKNPGLRSLAKLMLNSMWGKFGQKPNKTQVQQFTDPIQFHDFISSDQLDIHKIQIHKNNEDLVEVFYTKQEEDMDIHSNLNIFIACFTTCWARLRLYDALDMLGERVLYYDTDSIIYVQNLDDPEEQQPELGDYLGDFTNELKPPTDYIVEFASAGPKNYGYVTAAGKKECKVKGFGLNTEGSRYINYQLLRDNVKLEIQQPFYHPGKNQMLTRQYPVKRSYRNCTRSHYVPAGDQGGSQELSVGV